jgi:hypothetical protein
VTIPLSGDHVVVAVPDSGGLEIDVSQRPIADSPPLAAALTAQFESLVQTGQLLAVPGIHPTSK